MSVWYNANTTLKLYLENCIESTLPFVKKGFVLLYPFEVKLNKKLCI